MPSTYTLNNGIELIATGEQSGTWGDTTNVNLGLIDTALDGQVTITLPAAGSSGSPNALAISDGSASNGRNRLIIFTDGGDLGATAFVQLTPNDAEKIVYIRNSLTGGRALTLFQGTYNASNDYEVPAGTTAVVFFNGGGSGAIAANVFNNAYFDSLRLGSVSVTAILDEDNMASNSATALATQQSIKAYVDAQVGANNELSEVLANGNTSGANNIQMTTTAEVQFRDTALKINSSADGQLDIDADVELELTAPTLDINASTAVTIDTATLTMTGSVNVVGDLDVDNLNLNGNAIISTNTNGDIDLTPNGTGEVNISKVDINGGTIDGTVIGGSSAAAGTFTTATATTGNITTVNATTVDTTNIEVTTLKAKDGTSAGSIADSTGVVTLASSVLTTTDINGGTVDGAVIGGSSAAAITGTTITATGDVTIADKIIHAGDTNTAIRFPAADTVTVETSGVERLRVDSSGNVGIGTSSPTGLLTIGTSAPRLDFLETGGSTGFDTTTLFRDGDIFGIQTRNAGTFVSNDYRISTNASGALTHEWRIGNTERMRINSAGNVGIGTSAPAAKLEVSGDIISVVNGTSSIAARSGDNTNYSQLRFRQTATESRIESFAAGTGTFAPLTFHVNSAERMRITSAGNVGIGTSSPTQALQVSGAIVATGTAATYSADGIYLQNKGSSVFDVSAWRTGANASILTFSTDSGSDVAPVERMRINLNGDISFYEDTGTTPKFFWDASAEALLVGKTAVNNTTAGHRFDASGFMSHVRDGDAIALYNRLTSDGDIIEFRKDGTTVGSIGTAQSTVYLDGTKTNASGIFLQNDAIIPRRNQNYDNGNVDLGGTSNRFKDLYLSGGVYVGGTGSANLLDDYEEGTWTPTVASGSLSVTGARYTKIGSLVTLFCDFTVASGGSNIIQGIPFACNVTAGMSPYQSGQAIAASRSSIALAIAGDTIYVRSIGDNIAFSGTNLTTGAVFHFTLSYDTTA
jgi:hypothetical protein